MADRARDIYSIWLACCEELSYSAYGRLIEAYGSAQQVFAQGDALAAAILTPAGLERLQALRRSTPQKVMQRLQQLQVQTALPQEENYPALLRTIIEPPHVLFYKGSLPAQPYHAAAIVGSRRETRYGREQAYQIAKALAAQGIVVVSGLARGIDTAAHQGALDAGGITWAVLGSGIEQIYPQENMELAQRIIQSGGAIISELAPNAQPLAYHFPLRNRLISGLADALLLVEAREKSGTLITVGHALAQGREVFALPGAVDSPGSAIPHRLIREGARLVTCAQDILEDMGWELRKQGESSQVRLDAALLTNEQMKIYHALDDGERGYEELLLLTGLTAPELNAQLTLLEMDRVIDALPGRMFRLVIKMQ